MRSRSRPNHMLAVAALLIAALATPGCGSSKKKDKASSTPTITKAAFLAKGNAICAKGNKVTDAANQKLPKTSTKAQFEAIVKKVDLPSIQSQINAIRALGAPAGDEATVKKMLTLAQADLDKVKRDPASLGAKGDRFADFAKIAHPYGLRACDPNS